VSSILGLHGLGVSAANSVEFDEERRGSLSVGVEQYIFE
jgi:hypothetical protein